MTHRPAAFILSLCILFSNSAMAESFKLTSSDISDGTFMSAAQEFQGFGCTGGNRSPHLSWSGAPAKTEAFAVFAYDPDAPTGSGWWHWQLVNIPKEVTSLAAGIGETGKGLTPAGSISVTNDYGIAGFGGACPPRGHGVHRYQFTVYALSKKLDLPAGASGALTGYMVRAHALGSSTIEALYKRD
ncbi:PEBP family protein [Methylobacterium sp. 4-46]|uniref:YbhB/YbcL family Raf kinase inhibitor-like protein n=1 Tax=unclassified Methylobacterium TaxID=2615210 RepID=UPI000152C480|nr:MULTISPECIES: YbhB/YbcL family Raf kinase inhibitor-like protein [Methylobacterium]ACA16193.1 PEBP family protein [Methylobacterium sp. 4-46]WFT81901.1 YbhB/YbcL family Raf kinase inhibitor-like protein [Methylobacterium nodulans]